MADISNSTITPEIGAPLSVDERAQLDAFKDLENEWHAVMYLSSVIDTLVEKTFGPQRAMARETGSVVLSERALNEFMFLACHSNTKAELFHRKFYACWGVKALEVDND